MLFPFFYKVQHWVSVLLAVYGAALVGICPFCGWFADKSPNRRMPLLISLLALGGATLLLCFGNSIALLIVGRVLQGISAATVWTVGLALLADTVGPLKIGQSIGYVGISMSVATLVAPMVGGIVYDKVGYFPVYYVAFGMILLDIALRFILVEKKVAHRWQMAAVNVAPTPHAGAEENKSSSVIATSSPTSPPQPPHEPPASGEGSWPLRKMLRSPRLLASLFATVVVALLLTAWDATLPLHVSGLFGWSSLGAGLIFLPVLMPSFFSPVIGIWTDRQGARMPVVFGFLIVIPFVVCLRFVDGPEGSGRGHTGKVVLLCVLLAGVGFGLSMAMVPLIAEIVYVLEKECPTLPPSAATPTTTTNTTITSPAAASAPPEPPTTGIAPVPLAGVAAPATTAVAAAAVAAETPHHSKRNSYATAYGMSNAAFAGGMLAGPLFGGFVRSTAGWGTMCWGLSIISVGGAVGALWVGEGWVVRRGRSEVSGSKTEAEGDGDVESQREQQEPPLFQRRVEAEGESDVIRGSGGRDGEKAALRLD